MSSYPYQDRFPVNRTLPEHGRPRDEVLAEMRALAAEEDASWEGGRVSGTMYCGDHDHYSFMNDVFGLYAHVNILQRDICPSATRYEGEVIAMALDLMHADAVTDGEPVGLVTSGGTGSICHAVLAFREVAREERGVTRPNFIKPETGHPAFDKACHLFGIEMRHVPVDPVTMQADVEAVRAAIDDQTIGFMGSACNYGYGTIDPIEALSDLAVETGLPLHVDGCLGGFILPFGEELGFDIPPFDFRHPGVTSISADTHKYGYAFKGTSTVLFRDKRWRNSQYFFLTDWTGGKYCSPGMDGSRSGGLLAATWAAMVQLGREGYRSYAEQMLETSKAMQEAVRSHPELRILGDPSFLFSFTSDEFDIYSRQRLHAAEGLALQRPAVPQRPAHGGHPAPDPGRRGGGVRQRPGGSRRVRQGEGPRARRLGRHLRRRGRRHERRGRRVHQDGHGPDARRAAGPAAARLIWPRAG
ncbi:MAG: pyridoxal-dependent decarboxylase [Acidimicrobiales bacterium]